MDAQGVRTQSPRGLAEEAVTKKRYRRQKVGIPSLSTVTGHTLWTINYTELPSGCNSGSPFLPTYFWIIFFFQSPLASLSVNILFSFFIIFSFKAYMQKHSKKNVGSSLNHFSTWWKRNCKAHFIFSALKTQTYQKISSKILICHDLTNPSTEKININSISKCRKYSM